MKSSNKLYAWLDGKIIKSEDAKIHILTHSVQYGSGIFEGMRAYKTSEGTAIFRLDDHVKRFFNSAKVYEMNLRYSTKEIKASIIKTVKINKLSECYIRPFAFYNDTNLGVSAFGRRVSVFIGAIQFGAYFGKGKELGIRCHISSWRRINSDIMPPEAKASGNYINSILANLDAKNSGAEEAILTSSDGYVAEGPGENIFLVQDGKLITPSRESDILLGITRDSIIKIAENTGLEVVERLVHKEELYDSDEAFFTGTAAEVTPVVSVDSRKLGRGKPGPITKMLAGKYSQVVHGEDEEFKNWLTYV